VLHGSAQQKKPSSRPSRRDDAEDMARLYRGTRAALMLVVAIGTRLGSIAT
jgi:hypothetical protein